MGVAEDVLEQYPSLAFLINDPEIGPLLTRAVDPNQGFSPQTFQAKLYQTNWWRTTPAAAREAQIKYYTDPATLRQEGRTIGRSIQDYAARLGVSLAPNQLEALQRWSLQNGITSPEDPLIRNRIIAIGNRGGGQGFGGGSVMTARHQAAQYVRSQFLRDLPKKWANAWGQWLATGQRTMEDLRDVEYARALKAYPHLSAELHAGQTLAEIVSPLRELVATELEYGSVEQVDIQHNPEWRKLLGVKDANGKTRMPTESEVIELARNRPQWWQTSNGRQADSAMTSTMLQAFGKRAG